MTTSEATRIQSLARWRTGFALATVVLPGLLGWLLVRQANRLDALATHGEPVEAHVTRISADGGGTFYSYDVAGVPYDWNVARDEAPYAPGTTFEASYLPEDPSFTRPTTDREAIARQAAGVRGFAWKFAGGLAALLLLITALAQRDLEKRRRLGPPPPLDARAYRRRLSVAFGLTLVPMGGVVAWHWSDARTKGESIVPVVLAAALALAIVGGVFFVALRGGPASAPERLRRIARWAAPVAVLVALARLAAYLFGG